MQDILLLSQIPPQTEAALGAGSAGLQNILFVYEMPPTTWLYLSSLMAIGIFFKFHRFWSVRNLDLAAMLAFAPGLLLVGNELDRWGYASLGIQLARWGYVWLFVVGAFFLVRLLLDPIMVRRPLLEPNLNASGLTFTCVALFVFIMANVVTNRAQQHGSMPTLRVEQVLARNPAKAETRPPGYPWFQELAERSSRDVGPSEGARAVFQVTAVRAMAICGHLAVIIGLMLIGYRHFDNFHTGAGTATLYLLLFYTSQMAGRVDHAIPAALLVWAVESYRRPVVAGLLIGAAAGLVFYPVFLLPLWFGFYWRRGAVRFAIGLIGVMVLMVLLLLVGVEPFWTKLEQMTGWTSLSLADADGFWKPGLQAYRIPMMAAFLALIFSLALWPAQKHLGALLSCSAAVMLGTQFWQAHQGGLFMAWYLPLLVLTVFRPNLEDRVALTAVREGWMWRRRR